MTQEELENGDMVPKFEVSAVQFSHDDKIKVNAKDLASQYKTEEFEQAVKNWLDETLVQREIDFATKFGESIDEWTALFDFSKLALARPDAPDSTITETMNDGVSVKGKYLTGVFRSEFECKTDEEGLAKDMRRSWSNNQNVFDSPEVVFNETNKFQRDVQIVFDENFMNEIFFNQFHSKGSMYSLNQQLLKLIYMGTDIIASNPLTSNLHK